MTKDESRAEIVALWEQHRQEYCWRERKLYHEIEYFFDRVKQERPELLQWRLRLGDSVWHEVKGWIYAVEEARSAE